jgi:hypothetical protein
VLKSRARGPLKCGPSPFATASSVAAARKESPFRPQRRGAGTHNAAAVEPPQIQLVRTPESGELM